MKQLTAIDRLTAVAHGKKVDHQPCICPGGMMNMIITEIMERSGISWPEAHSNAEQMAALTYGLNHAGGFENYGVPFCMTVEAEAMGATVDMGDAQTEPHVVDSPLSSATQLDQLAPFSLDQGRIPTVLTAIRLLKAKGTGVPVIANITGPVSVAGTLVDMTSLLMELRKKPEACHRLMSLITDNLITYGQAQVAAGADAICIAEPSGTGEILGRRFFHEYSLPYLNRLLDSLEVPVKIVHICGRLHSIYEELSALHCDAFSFDACVSIEEIKPYLAGKAIMGNVNTHALGSMSGHKIEQLTKAALNKGADIVAPACGLPLTTPLANIQTMVATVRNEFSGDEQHELSD